jgi:hypothetical protein
LRFWEVSEVIKEREPEGIEGSVSIGPSQNSFRFSFESLAAHRERATVGYYYNFKTVNFFLNLRDMKRLER